MVSSSQLRFAAFRAFGEVIPKNCIECPYPCGASMSFFDIPPFKYVIRHMLKISTDLCTSSTLPLIKSVPSEAIATPLDVGGHVRTLDTDLECT